MFLSNLLIILLLDLLLLLKDEDLPFAPSSSSMTQFGSNSAFGSRAGGAGGGPSSLVEGGLSSPTVSHGSFICPPQII